MYRFLLFLCKPFILLIHTKCRNISISTFSETSPPTMYCKWRDLIRQTLWTPPLFFVVFKCNVWHFGGIIVVPDYGQVLAVMHLVPFLVMSEFCVTPFNCLLYEGTRLFGNPFCYQIDWRWRNATLYWYGWGWSLNVLQSLL